MDKNNIFTGSLKILFNNIMGSICSKDDDYMINNKLCSDCIYLENNIKTLEQEIESYKLIIEFRDRRIQLLENNLRIYDKYY